MGRTHTFLNSDETPRPINNTEKGYPKPPMLGSSDSDNSTTMKGSGPRLTPVIGSEPEYEMGSKLESPRLLHGAGAASRRRRPNDAMHMGGIYTDGSSSLAHSSEDLEGLQASGMNEAFAKRWEEMCYLAEKTQSKSARRPQPRARREVRATRDQAANIEVANKNVTGPRHKSNTNHCPKTLKEICGTSSSN